MSTEDYDEYTFVSDEEKLAPVKVNLERESPVPPPFLPQQSQFKERRKTGYSPGDAALVRSMNPDDHSIISNAARSTLRPEDSPPQAEKTEESLDDRLAREWYEQEKRKKLDEAAEVATKVLFPNYQHSQRNLLDASPPPPPRPPPPPKKMALVINPDTFAKPYAPMHRDEPPASARFGPVKTEHPLTRRQSLPPRVEQELFTSPVGHHLREPPTPQHELAPIKPNEVTTPQSATSPSSKGPTIPGIAPLKELADQINENQSTRSRASSLIQTPNLSTSSTFPPFSNSHASPTESITSPRSGYGPAGLSIGIARRPSMASENYPPLPSASTATASDYHPSPAADAFSPTDTLNGTAITTPSDSGIRSRDVGFRIPTNPSTVTSPQSVYQAENPTPNRIAISAASPGLAILAPSSALPQFQCTYIGCTAPPFQTQYLLNSHATVHSQDRPHYCTVPGCPRGPGGEGFKRKNEMKRHGLVHRSPGYICPYCPDREHRYPRPDNLQRHVRVHHRDIPLTDQKLRDVLDKKVDDPILAAKAQRRQSRRRVRASSGSSGSATRNTVPNAQPIAPGSHDADGDTAMQI